MLLFDFVEAADARAENDAATIGVFLGEIQAGIAHGINARHQRKLGKAVDALGILRRNVGVGRPIPNFAGEPHFEVRGGEQVDRTHAAFAGADPFPQVLNLAAQPGNGAETGDDDSAFHLFALA